MTETSQSTLDHLSPDTASAAARPMESVEPMEPMEPMASSAPGASEPSELADDIEAIAHAQAVVTRAKTSFAPGMRILPKDRRNGMFAIYAFCREIDDIADEEGTSDEKMAALAEWRAEIDRVFEGAPTSLTGRALLKPVRQYNLSKDEFILLIEGMEMDALGPIAAPDYETYLAYCRRVAGAVGMLSMPIFGAGTGEAQTRFAVALANALQTTNILRDVAEDAAIDRIYLPKELLKAHGIADANPKTLMQQPGLTGVCRDLSVKADAFFAEAREALSDFDWRTARPALLMMGIYHRYWHKLDAVGWNPNISVHMSKWEKLGIALRYLLAPPIHKG